MQCYQFLKSCSYLGIKLNYSGNFICVVLVFDAVISHTKWTATPINFYSAVCTEILQMVTNKTKKSRRPSQQTPKLHKTLYIWVLEQISRDLHAFKPWGFFFPQTCNSHPAILWLLTVLLSIYFIQTQVLSLNIIQTRHLITKVSSVFKELLKEERKKANQSLGRSCTLHKLVQGRKWIGNPIRLWARLCTVAIWEP